MINVSNETKNTNSIMSIVSVFRAQALSKIFTRPAYLGVWYNKENVLQFPIFPLVLHPKPTCNG